MGRVPLLAAVGTAGLAFALPAQAADVASPRAGSLAVRSNPGGSVVARLGARTEFGSRLVLAVAARRPGWLGVITSRLPNGRLGWVRARDVRLARIETRIVVSLSARRLRLYRGSSLEASIPVGIGSAASPTPTGVFAITDELAGANFSPVYGCCILALSGRQPRVPSGWRGSDNRLAIHVGGYGAVSAGCLHASTTALRFLMARVPLGTRVTIRR